MGFKNSKQYWLITIMTGCLVIFMILACKHEVEDLPGAGTGSGPGTGPGPGPGGGSSVPCDPTKVYFQQQVLPILVSNCAMSGCHDAASHQDGVILTSYASVMATADIEPGDPGDSELYERITDNDPDDRMPRPPRSPLTTEQKDIIRRWIQQGALNLVCDNMCDSTSFTYGIAIRAIISNKCQGCHSGSAPQGGIDLSTYNGVKAKVNDGRLWGAINHLPGFSAMPRGGAKLSDCEIAQVRKWIAAGAPNN